LLLKDCNARIERIVKKLKEFSRQSKFEFASMNVNDAVMSVLAITRQQLLNHGIELKIFLPEGLPLVLGDINQIEQVLLNLIANAIDAMVESPDKVLIIETALGEKGQMVQIKVTDKGIGMTSEQIEQIFNPFLPQKMPTRGQAWGFQ